MIVETGAIAQINEQPQAGRLNGILEAAGSMVSSVIDNLPRPSWRGAGRLAMAGLVVAGVDRYVGGEPSAEAAPGGTVTFRAYCQPGTKNGMVDINNGTDYKTYMVVRLTRPDGSVRTDPGDLNPGQTTTGIPNYMYPSQDNPPAIGTVTLEVTGAKDPQNNYQDVTPLPASPASQSIDCGSEPAPTPATTAAPTPTTRVTAAPTTIARVTSSVPVTAPRPTTPTSREVAPAAPANTTLPPPPTAPPTETTLPPVVDASPVIEAVPVGRAVSPGSRRSLVVAEASNKNEGRNDDLRSGGLIGLGAALLLGASGLALNRRHRHHNPKQPKAPRNRRVRPV